MEFMWGDVQMNVVESTYNPPFAKPVISEIMILPAIGDTNAASIIQQGGRERYRAGFDGYFLTKAECDALMADYTFMTERIWTGADGESMLMVIEELTPFKRTVKGLFEFTIKLVEA